MRLFTLLLWACTAGDNPKPEGNQTPQPSDESTSEQTVTDDPTTDDETTTDETTSDETGEPEDTELPPRSDLSFHYAGNNFRGWEHGYFAGYGSDITSFPDGRKLRLDVPSIYGPGVQIHVAEPNQTVLHNQTQTLLPDEYGLHKTFIDGIFVDLNVDGWDDILLVRDKGSHEATGYLWHPDSQQFVPLPFNTDHNANGSTVDEVTAFFGRQTISYHTLRILAEDFDGDGDDDIFVARRFGNYIFENISSSSWSIEDALDGSTIVPRFQAHVLDSISRQTTVTSSGTSHTIISNQSANTTVSQMLPTATGTMIAAADGQCVSGYCGQTTGVGPKTYAHVYGQRDVNHECECGNDLCEVGEIDGCPDDCESNSSIHNAVIEELSCRFVDYARHEIDIHPTAIAVFDSDQDGYRDDFWLFGGPHSTTQTHTVRDCFDNPSSCNPSDWSQLLNLQVHHQSDQTWALQTPSEAPFASLYVHAKAAVGVDIDGDSSDEVVVFHPLMQENQTAMTVFDRNGQLHDCPGLGHDYDAQGLELFATAWDDDGYADVNLIALMEHRTYWGTSNESGQACLQLDRKVPTFSRNLKKPAIFDCDNDGDLDLFYQSWADTDQDVAERLLLINDGSGSFSPNTQALQNVPAYFGGTATAVDIDGDGDQDLIASTVGPLQIMENRLIPDGQVSFVERLDWLPPYYTSGGDIHGKVWEDCRSAPPAESVKRCYGAHLAVADFDGNGAPDIAISVRKGSNDILFNNLFGTICEVGTDTGCARTGMLSARTDLFIQSLYPTTVDPDFGYYNRTNGLIADDFGSPDGKPDILALAAPNYGFQGMYDKLFHNAITAPFPHAIACSSDADCPETCTPVGSFLPNIATCTQQDKQVINNGWFDDTQTIPTRNGSDQTDRYRNTGCFASGDLNGDGFVDFAVVSRSSEDVPDLQGVKRLREVAATESGVCSLFQGTDANETSCDVVIQCNPWHCENTNPEALLVGAGNVYPETDSRCCQEFVVANATFEKPACASWGASNVDQCDVRGFQRITSHDGVDDILDTKAFFYLWDEAQQQFQPHTNVLDIPEADMENAQIFSCDIQDFDHDGDMDFVHSGYLTGNQPASITSLPLLTSDTWNRRRQAKMSPSRLWLNPGWTANDAATPFSRGSFPVKSDKIYFMTSADIDGDGYLEILTTGADHVGIYDDPKDQE